MWNRGQAQNSQSGLDMFRPSRSQKLVLDRKTQTAFKDSIGFIMKLTVTIGNLVL